jgi:hypothetical protein
LEGLAPIIVTNYYFIPIAYQPLFVNAVGLFWNCYLSHQNNINKKKLKLKSN